MSARRQIIADLSEDSLGGIATLQDVTNAEALVDADRSEAITEGINALRTWDQSASSTLAPGLNFAIGVLMSVRDDRTGEKDTTPAATAADAKAYAGELAMLRGLVRTLRLVARQDDLAEVQRLLTEHAGDERDARAEAGEKATATATTATPTDTNRRARLLHEMAYDGGRWKSGDVVAWYQTQGLTGLGIRAARHDLATLRDSGAITQHDERGVRFYTLATLNSRKDGSS